MFTNMHIKISNEIIGRVWPILTVGEGMHLLNSIFDIPIYTTCILDVSIGFSKLCYQHAS